MRGLAQHLHRDDAAHGETGEGKAGRGVVEDLGREDLNGVAFSWQDVADLSWVHWPDRPPHMRASHIMPGIRTSGII